MTYLLESMSSATNALVEDYPNAIKQLRAFPSLKKALRDLQIKTLA
jgi:hypothetical protein